MDADPINIVGMVMAGKGAECVSVRVPENSKIAYADPDTFRRITSRVFGKFALRRWFDVQTSFGTVRVFPDRRYRVRSVLRKFLR